MPLNLPPIMSARNLIGTIQAVKPGLPDVLHPGFESQTTKKVSGNTSTYFSVDGTRETAKLVHYGAPSVRRTLSGVAEKPVVLPHFKENIDVKAHDLVNLMDQDENRQRLGEAEIARLVQEAKQILVNTRRAMLASALALGKIYIGSDGKMLSSSSGAQIEIDFAIPSGNKDQLNVFGDGAIIDASWGTAGTKIVRHIQLLMKAAARLSGYAITDAIYGANILDYFLGNTQLKEIIFRNATYQDAFSKGIVPNGFLGLRWWPGYQFFWQDGTSYKEVVGGDTIVFHPTPDPTWFEWQEGSAPVPGDLGKVSGDLEDAVASITLATGMFAYAKVTDDPVGATMIYGDTNLPIVKAKKSIFIADVVP